MSETAVTESDVVYVAYESSQVDSRNSSHFTWQRDDQDGKTDDLLLVSLVAKPEDVIWNLNEGWKVLTEFSGGADEAYANRKGNVKLTIFARELESDSELIFGSEFLFTNNGDTNGSIATCSGLMTLLRKPKGSKWDYSQFVFGEDKVHNVSFLVTCPEILPLKNRDLLFLTYGDDAGDSNVADGFDDLGGEITVSGRPYQVYQSRGNTDSSGYDCGTGVSITNITDPDETGGNVSLNVPVVANGRSCCGAMVALRVRAIPPPPPPPRRIRSTGVPADPKPPDRLLMRTSPAYDNSVFSVPTNICNCGIYSVYVGDASDSLGVIHRCYGCRRPVARCICG